MSPLLTQRSLLHLIIDYALVLGPLTLLGTGAVLAFRRWGGAR